LQKSIRDVVSGHKQSDPDAHPPRMTHGPMNVVGTALAVAVGGFLLGFDATVISGVAPLIREYFALGGAAGSLRLGWAVSALGWGAMAGNLCAGVLCDRFGRRATLLLTAAVFLASALTAALSTSFDAFVAARFCSGVAVGTAIVTAPLYIAEVAPADRRGGLVSLNQLMIVVGISLSFLVNYFFLALGADGWRWMLGVQVLPALAYFLLLTRVPESPRWLLGRGSEERARDVLVALHGPLEAGREMAEIRSSLAAGSPVSRLRSVFSARLRFVLAFALGIALVQQATGINAVLYYLPTIFAQAGDGLASAFGQSVLVGMVNVGMTLVAIRLIDRIGRRPLLIAGVAGMALALLAISWAFHAAATPTGAATPVNANAVLLSIMVFVACFAMSLGPVMWVLLSEIFPNEQRAEAIALVGFWNSLVSASVTFVFPWELATLGPAGTFLVYGLLAVAGLLFLLVFAPETKGRTLEQLEGQLLRPAGSPA
jgi:sugar porter (SP) family MFS transporter